jgi:hypothetical protein
MKAFSLICILIFGMAASCLFAAKDVTKGDYLEIKCTIIDSTGTSKDAFALNEPATYVLSIRNVSDFPISYRYSSENSSLFSVMVKTASSVDNSSSSLSPVVLDSDGVLESGDVLRDTNTVTMSESGKYEFVINPNFNFPKNYWPSTGPLYRIFTVGTPGE